MQRSNVLLISSARVRNVSPSLLDLDGAVDVAILRATAPKDHSLRGLLLVLFREVPEIIDLALCHVSKTTRHSCRGEAPTLVNVRPAVTKYPSRPW